MTLLLAKHCTDGILVISDGIKIVTDSADPIAVAYSSGEKKLLSGKRHGRNFLIVHGGHAGMDDLKPVAKWIEDEVEKPGRIVDRVSDGLFLALRDAQANADWENESERINWELNGNGAKSYALATDEPNKLWMAIRDVDRLDLRDEVVPGHVAITQPEMGPEWDTLHARCLHRAMTLAECILHFSALFDQAVNTLHRGCRYPGHYGFLRTDGTAETGGFSSAADLAAVAKHI